MKKKITLILSSVVALIVFGMITLYVTATNPLKNNEEKAISRAKSEVDISEVTHVDWFYYTDSYYIIEGKTSLGDEIVVWVPDDVDRDIIVRNSEDGLSRNEVLQIVQNGLSDFSDDRRPKEIIRIKLGMVEQVPAYEVTYLDREDRYTILYIDFYDGNWYRVYNL